MYLFWVLTLCTQTEARMCFFRKKTKKTQKQVEKEETPSHCTFRFSAVLAFFSLGDQAVPATFQDPGPHVPAAPANITLQASACDLQRGRQGPQALPLSLMDWGA